MVMMMVRGENNRGQNKLLWEEEFVYAAVAPKCSSSQGSRCHSNVSNMVWRGYPSEGDVEDMPR
jgi:hypothetical protein